MKKRELAFVMLSVIILMQYAAFVPVQAPEQSSNGWAEVPASFDSMKFQSQSAWLSGWDHRWAYTLAAIPGAGTLYQVRIVIHYGQGYDSGEDIYCGSTCQPDFDDIRFTRDDGVTLQNHWRQSCVTYDNAVFWVKVADDLNSSVTMYVYCGNASVGSASNGEATFIFFDDFSGNLDKWSIYDDSDYPQIHSYDVANSQIHVHAESNEWVATSGYIIRTSDSFNSVGATGIHVCASGNWQNLQFDRAEGWIQCLAFEEGQETGWNVRLRGDFGVTIWEYFDVTYNQVADPADYSSGGTQFDYYVSSASKSFDLRLVSDRPGYSLSDNKTLPNFKLDSYKICLWATVQSWTGPVSADIYYDYVFLAKWVPSYVPSYTWQQNGITTQTSTGTSYYPSDISPATIMLAIWIVFSIAIVSVPVFLTNRHSWRSV